MPDDGRDHLPDRLVTQQFDVLIAGGGPAGCAAAATAARAGARVAILDAAGGPARIGEGAAPGISSLIEEIFGTGSGAFSPEVHLSCPSIVSAWGSPEPAVVDHMLNPLGHAWSLDRARFHSDLRAAAELLGVDVRSTASARAVRGEAGAWEVDFADRADRAGRLEARVVIDASGRGARVAQQQGARKRHIDRQVALWAVWEVAERDRSSSLYIEAVPGGWWYSALLPGQRRIVVHLTDADLLPTGSDERAGIAESARSLELIGGVLGISGRPRLGAGPRVTSARTGWIERFAGPGWVAAGDAAVTSDPLSGRGMVIALLSGRTAGAAAAELASGGGSTVAVAHHKQQLGAVLDDTLAQRTDTYRAEMRWPESEYWARRHRDVASPSTPGRI
ncbi:MAG TPA: tryptophan 7-halogenase [Solirubrobacteraceae bacterium]